MPPVAQDSSAAPAAAPAGRQVKLLLAGAAAVAAALLTPSAAAAAGGRRAGEAFVQAAPAAEGLLGRPDALPIAWKSQLFSAPATSAPPPPAAASGLRLFAAAACAVATAAAARARIALRAKGKPTTTSGIRVRKPKCNSLRHTSIATFEELTTSKRYEPLVFMFRRRFAVQRGGHITMASRTRRQSGHKYRDFSLHARMYRVIDWGRKKRGIFGTIETIEYDPYRNARICLVNYEDGEKRYILHAVGFFVGQQVIADEEAPIYVGNAMPLDKIPVGTQVHNIEMHPCRTKGGRLARAAGTSAIVLAKDEKWVTVKLPSSEVRLLKKECWATIGKVGRPEAQLIKLGKAGKRRQLGWTPHIRGTAKNAVDHPHGGGEGRSPIGHKFQKTPFGKCAIGLKTRSPRKPSTKLILIRRKKKSGRA
mmetsp:Transcript_114076/g.285379  ORF Transcript_114076/g.285379 Transcript_114076/m.285379 type:complete len:422 (-) Transcript_114076:44-1309(-)